jgi:alpha-glucoside transport system ATP-binding protein
VAQFIGSPSMNILAGEIDQPGEETMVKLANGGRTRVAITTRDSDRGLKVNLGVRPEDMEPSEGDEWVYEGEVEITEALGEVTLLYFKGEGEAQVVAKLPGIHRDLRHKNVRLTARPDKLHLFANGRSLRYR